MQNLQIGPLHKWLCASVDDEGKSQIREAPLTDGIESQN